MSPTRERLMRTGSTALAIAGLTLGTAAALIGADRLAAAAWLSTTLIGVALAAVWVGVAAHRGRVGVDVIALAALLGANRGR